MINIKNNLKQFENLKEMANKNNKIITISEITTVFPNCGEDDVMEICDYLHVVGVYVIGAPVKVTGYNINNKNINFISNKDLSLIKNYQDGINAHKCLNKFSLLLNNDEIERLELKIKVGNNASKKLLYSHFNLITSIVKRYRKNYIYEESLYTLASKAFIESLAGYDYNQGISIDDFSIKYIDKYIDNVFNASFLDLLQYGYHNPNIDEEYFD